MEFIFEYQNVSASERLENLVREKLLRLQTKFSFVHRADIFFKTENRTDNNGMVCTIRLSMPGPRLAAETKASTFESAVSETVRDLNRQLAKREETMQS
nr:HPF/RaiA family ribosome-associated protein [uncultured Allomuricauda sp.]